MLMQSVLQSFDIQYKHVWLKKFIACSDVCPLDTYLK